MPILAFGTESQKRRYLPGLCDGRLLGANAASEPEAGSDIFGMQTRAERHGDGWVLNGRKTWITSGADRRPRRLLRQHGSLQGSARHHGVPRGARDAGISGGPPDREPGPAHRPHG